MSKSPANGSRMTIIGPSPNDLWSAAMRLLAPSIEGAQQHQFFWKFGAGEGIRTLDPNLGKVVLYH